MNTELTERDFDILRLLQHDASLSSGDIAERVNMSQSPCWRRINRAEEMGVLQRRVALLDRRQLGFDLVVFTTVNLSTQGRQNLEDFEREVMGLPEVLECYTMAGVWDYMLKIVVRDIAHYERFARNRLMALPGIGETHSHVAVTEIKNSTELPI